MAVPAEGNEGRPRRRAGQPDLGGAVTPVAEYEGTICADTLTPQKAKILLQLTLLKTRNIQEIKEAFREY